MKNLTVNVKQKGYDALQDVVNFNLVSGNSCEVRGVDEDLPSLYLDLIEEEMAELDMAVQEKDMKEILDGAADLIVVAAGLIHSLGYHPNDVMKIISQSNMSKFCKDEEEAAKSVQQYAYDPRYEKVHYKEVEYGNKTFYIVRGKKRNSDNDGWKILKSWKYEDASHKLIKLIRETNS